MAGAEGGCFLEVSGHGRTRDMRVEPTAGASAGAVSWVVGSSAIVSVFWGNEAEGAADPTSLRPQRAWEECWV